MRLRKNSHLFVFYGNITNSLMLLHLVYGIHFPLLLFCDSDTNFVLDSGTLSWRVDFRSGMVFSRDSWAVVINMARVPLGAKKVTALGRMVSRRSTARRVTTSAWELRRGARTSARPVITLMLVNVSARATSLRKAAFL